MLIFCGFIQVYVFTPNHHLKPSTSNWSPWCQVVARQCFVTQSGHCTPKYVKQEKVVELPHPLYSPDPATCDFFLFSRLKKHLSGRKYKTRKNLGSAIFQCLNSIPRKDYENAFKNWIKRLKLCVSHGGVF